MKQRSTTPVSAKVRVRRVILGGFAALFAVATPIHMMTQEASADQYDSKIDAIQREIDRYQEQARGLSDKADTLQRRLNELTVERQTLQAQIDLNQAQHDKLQKQIDDNKKRIAANRDALGDTLADMYVEGGVSPLEMLASSSTIGDYLDKQERLAAVRDNLKTTIDDINSAQEELEKQQEAVKLVLANQTNTRNALVASENEQKQLVDQTRGEEAAYQQLIKEGQAEQSKLREQQAQQRAIEAAQRAAGSVVSIGGSSGGYPWHEGNCTVGYDALSRGGADGRGGDGWGYGCRQCASYVAWKIGQHTGFIPTYVGDAKNFVSLGTNHRTARANSVGIMTAGQYGHVVWVETDPDAAGMITVSQYNYYDPSQGGSGWGHFTRMRVHQSTYNAFVYY